MAGCPERTTQNVEDPMEICLRGCILPFCEIRRLRLYGCPAEGVHEAIVIPEYLVNFGVYFRCRKCLVPMTEPAS